MHILLLAQPPGPLTKACDVCQHAAVTLNIKFNVNDVNEKQQKNEKSLLLSSVYCARES